MEQPHERPRSPRKRRTAPGAGGGIEVRRATNDDAAAIAEISASVKEGSRRPYWPAESAAGGALYGDLTRLVACIEGRVVGTAQYCTKDDRVELLRLEVHEDHRRRGVARTLLEEVGKAGAREGAGKLTLHTVRETGHEPMLHKLGFTTVAESTLELQESGAPQTLTEITLERPLGR